MVAHEVTRHAVCARGASAGSLGPWAHRLGWERGGARRGGEPSRQPAHPSTRAEAHPSPAVESLPPH
eukprot:1485298-Prymnesium_polylepis.1